jgi:aldehyde:ferredoxin oxidoreductase
LFGEQAEYESVNLSYDYELIFSLGTFLGISEPSDILELIEKTELDGLDSIASGIVLGWVTEAYQKGLITKDELALNTVMVGSSTSNHHNREDDGISFGETKKYIKILDNLTHLKNDFYKDLAKGLDYITSKRGGSDFAMTLGKNPIAGYHTGYASLLGQALVGVRHSHVDNGGYSIDQKDPNLPEEKIIDQLLDEQILREMLNCTGVCMFARKVYSKEVIRDALSSVGIEKTLDELDELGNKIYKLKLDIKRKMGFNFKDPGIPERFYQTTSPAGMLDKSKVGKMIEIFNTKIDK